MTFVAILESRADKVYQEQYLAQFDSVEVSLLTCSPHEEIYSLYGHSALRWHDQKAGSDIVFNWGLFDFNKPYFVLRFVFGLTDYEVGGFPYPLFLQEYKYVGSSVTEQVLNLTNTEKARLKDALEENLKPENSVYRYNYFYDNCSTRPRDIVERCLEGKVEYQARDDYQPSYREIVRVCTRNHPWATFGNDILLGVKADFKTNLREQEFLPDNLLYDFDRAQIYSDGSYRPLVKERRVALQSGVQVIEADFPLTPTECVVGLLALSLLILWWEWRSKKTLVAWDMLLMLLQGLAGCVLFMMLFSQHPATSTNLQLLLLNPLPLVFLYSVIRGRRNRWWYLQVVLIGSFLMGSLIQDYAEGMLILALCLLLRSCIHLIIDKKKA
ncbi:MAG: DUF4105 domain-containing protein [Prevotella sp.]|nr:DUF4105 domain-containing protein [Prevotella sp.]